MTTFSKISFHNSDAWGGSSISLKLLQTAWNIKYKRQQFYEKLNIACTVCRSWQLATAQVSSGWISVQAPPTRLSDNSGSILILHHLTQIDIPCLNFAIWSVRTLGHLSSKQKFTADYLAVLEFMLNLSAIICKDFCESNLWWAKRSTASIRPCRLCSCFKIDFSFKIYIRWIVRN